jgi:hypothetical protein
MEPAARVPRLKALGGRLSDRGEQRALLEAMEEAELISKANY